PNRSTKRWKRSAKSPANCACWESTWLPGAELPKKCLEVREVIKMGHEYFAPQGVFRSAISNSCRLRRLRRRTCRPSCGECGGRGVPRVDGERATGEP